MAEQQLNEKKTTIWDQLFAICLIFSYLVVFFLAANSLINQKIQKMRGEIRNELTIEFNKALAVRDQIMEQSIKNSNANVKICDDNLKQVLIWRERDVKAYNKTVKVYDERFIGLRRDLNESIAVSNDNIDSIDEEFDKLWENMQTTNSVVDNMFADSWKGARNNVVQLIGVQNNLDALNKWVSRIYQGPFGLLRIE